MSTSRNKEVYYQGHRCIASPSCLRVSRRDTVPPHTLWALRTIMTCTFMIESSNLPTTFCDTRYYEKEGVNVKPKGVVSLDATVRVKEGRPSALGPKDSVKTPGQSVTYFKIPIIYIYIYNGVFGGNTCVSVTGTLSMFRLFGFVRIRTDVYALRLSRRLEWDLAWGTLLLFEAFLLKFQPSQYEHNTHSCFPLYPFAPFASFFSMNPLPGTFSTCTGGNSFWSN